jgi:hypothetical protein
MLSFPFAAIEQFFNVGLAVTLGCLLAFLMFATSLVLAFRSRSWPTTEGRVLESTVESYTTHSSDRVNSQDISYKPVVRYTYSVEEKQLESKQIAFGSWTGSKTYAAGIIAKYPKHAVVTVYYHPKRHGMAVLVPGKYGMMLFLSLLCGTILCIVAVTWVRLSLHPDQNPWAELHQVQSNEK